MLDFDGLCGGGYAGGHGAGRAVTNANKREYLDRVAAAKLLHGRRRQLEAIRAGFNILDFGTHMRRFNANDLQVRGPIKMPHAALQRQCEDQSGPGEARLRERLG